MTILADVVAQEMKTAVDHRLYSTATCAGVYAHEESHAQMAKYSVSSNVTVFVPPNDLAVHLSVSIQKRAAVSVQTVPKHAPSLLKFLTHTLANASVPKYSIAVETSNLIHVHAVVSVQNQDPHVLMHRDLIPNLVHVNVQTGQINVPLGKSLTKLDAGVDALEFSIVQATNDSTPRLVGVSAQHRVQTAINHNFSTVFYVGVYVPAHDQSVHLHKCLIAGHVNASVQR